jgi:diaminobutyrate-2-oxoglutarate transaminase
MSLVTFERLESDVRSYIRSFPRLFTKAEGCWITDEKEDRYLDFFAGAGSLNYGHNHPVLKKPLIEYITNNGITHSLDMATLAKREFIEAFEQYILKPRDMDYKLQFTGPTGTNAVEAALKIARLATGRSEIICFTNAFHGVTAGSVATTGNSKFRNATGVSLSNSTFMPYCGYFGADIDTLEQIEKQLSDRSSGLDLPAAVLVECIQGEGGITTASAAWLQGLADLCKRFEILLIVDDIQMGCGRTGTFFSFDDIGIKPDIITISKSISGYGMPMALVLLRPELDVWEISAHNGTFRGNNLAFVTATETLRHFWKDDVFSQEIKAKGVIIHDHLQALAKKYHFIEEIRGRGMVAGIVFSEGAHADFVTEQAFGQENLILETCGSKGEVVKLLPPLIISHEELALGLKCIDNVLMKLQKQVDSAA